MSAATVYTVRHVEDRVYEVRAPDGFVLGIVRYDPDAWSIGRWFVDGVPRTFSTGGATFGKKRKADGWRRLADAAKYVATMASGVLMQHLTPCREARP